MTTKKVLMQHTFKGEFVNGERTNMTITIYEANYYGQPQKYVRGCKNIEYTVQGQRCIGPDFDQFDDGNTERIANWESKIKVARKNDK